MATNIQTKSMKLKGPSPGATPPFSNKAATMIPKRNITAIVNLSFRSILFNRINDRFSG